MGYNITITVNGTETYPVPEGINIPEGIDESELWDFIYGNNLEGEINYDSLQNGKVVSIETSDTHDDITDKIMK